MTIWLVHYYGKNYPDIIKGSILCDTPKEVYKEINSFEKYNSLVFSHVEMLKNEHKLL